MSTPKQNMERDEFYEQAMDPRHADEIALQIDRVVNTPPDMTFSAEAVDALSEQFRTFLMARIVAQMTSTGKPPHHVRATVTLDWNPGDPFEDAGLFYRIENDEGITPIDHTRRQWEVW